MNNITSWQDRIMYKRHIASHVMKNFDIIKSAPGTYTVEYPQYQKAFDYVDSLFPSMGIKRITVYLCPKKTLEEAGYSKAGGVYCTYSRIIIVADDLSDENISGIWSGVRACTTPDETLVHELLHYASDMRVKGRHIDEAYEEEFAYGYSIPYFLSKGWTEETIIDNYFLPYLINKLDSESIKKKILFKNGHNLIAFYKLSNKEQNKVLKSVEKDLYDETIFRAREEGKRIFKSYKDKRPEKEPLDDDFDFIVL